MTKTPHSLSLVALKGPTPQFDASKGEAGLPERILIMPWGTNETSQGKVTVNETTVAQLAAYNKAQNWDRPALDFEHNSVPGSATYAGEPVKVAGYGTLEVVPNEGIYLLMTSWTAEGRQYAAGGHYGDLSPVVKLNAAGEVIGCHSAALCRHGATHNLIFLSATPNQNDMQTKPPANAEELFLALRTALGASAEATPGQVMEALTARLAAPAAEKTMETEDKAPSDEVTKKLVSDVAALSATVTALTTQLDAKARLDVAALCAREGKVLPAAAKDLPLDKLVALAAELPVTVPMEKRTVDPLQLSSSAKPAGNPAIAAACGVTEDDIKKYGGNA